MNHRLSFLHIWRSSAHLAYLLLALLVVQGTARAQKTLTLKEAINSALQNRKSIQAGQSDQVIRRLQTEALYRKYLPQLSAEYSYLYNPILQTSILPIGVFNPNYPADATKSVQFGTKWTQTAGLALNQTLIDLSVTRAISEAKLQERITAATQAQTEYDLAYSVAQTYFDIQLQETKIKSAIADSTRTWASYQLLQNQFAQQRLLKSELNKGKINHNNAVQLHRNALALLIEDKVYLCFLMGMQDPNAPNVLLDTVLPNTVDVGSTHEHPTYTSIPELQQLELNSALTTQQIKTEKARYLPSLGLKGYLGANQYTNNLDPTASNTWFGQSYVGISVKYPLIFGGDRQKKVQQLKLKARQYGQQKDDKAAEYDKDAATAKIRMSRVAAELQTQQENINLRTESLAIYQARVAEGQESATNLNLEEADLQKLNADYQTNRRKYWLYYLDYLKASGQLTVLWK